MSKRYLFKAFFFTLVLLIVAYQAATASPIIVIPGQGAGTLYWKTTAAAENANVARDESLIGTISAFIKTPLPDFWLECKGQPVNATEYPELVKHLTGSDTATSATLPDLRGEFLRGWSHGRSGVDAGRTLLSFQGHSLPNHDHGVSTYNNNNGQFVSTNDGRRYDASNAPKSTYWNGNNGGSVNSHGGFGSSAALPIITTLQRAYGSTETRPRNVSVIYAIRTK